MSVVVVLHEPQDLVNIAAVVRAMKNFGLRDLRLVRPAEYDTFRIEGIAHKTRDILKRVAHFETLEEALADCRFVVGFTARGRSARQNAARPREAMPEIVAMADRGRVALVFGREDKGLSNAALDRCDRAVTLPTNPAHASLNLAQAFCVAAYELFLHRGEPAPLKPPRRRAPPATHAAVEETVMAAEQALDAIEFFKGRNPDVVMRTVRTVVHRTPLDAREAKLIKAMCMEVLRYFERTGLR
ncbi:MAG TPA: RNA methyltransferase [Gemmatimonadales bacterium]|jgi:TrmH family RNA methyltransferase